MDQTIAEINRFVMSRPWMDFTVWESNGFKLEVSGSIDESYQSDLRVVFEDVLWVGIRFQGWHSDTSHPVLIHVQGQDAYAMNVRFQIESGFSLFQFIAEDYEQPMWIAARNVTADFTRLDLTRNWQAP